MQKTFVASNWKQIKTPADNNCRNVKCIYYGLR